MYLAPGINGAEWVRRTHGVLGNAWFRLLCLVILGLPVTARGADAIETHRLIPEPEGVVERALFELRLNGSIISNGELVFMSDGNLWLPVRVLLENDLVVPDTGTGSVEPDAFLAVSELAYLSHSVDTSGQRAYLSASPFGFARQTLDFATLAQLEPAQSIPAAYVNYRITQVDRAGSNPVNAILEPGVTWGSFVFNNLLLAEDIGDENEWTRLESALIRDFPERRTRLVLGDARSRPANGSVLGNRLRFGGLQYGTRFEIDPAFTTYPLPSIYGEASDDSTVDLLIDGVLGSRSDVGPGPFTIENPPLINGAGELQVVVTDLAGNEEVFITPFYLSPSLLARGLSDFEINIGNLRESFSNDSDEYGDGFLSGRYRRGVTNKFTLEGLGEWSADHELAGVSGSFTLANLGVLAVGTSVTDSPLGTGSHYALSFDRQTRRYGIGFVYRDSDDKFYTFGDGDQSDNVKRQWSARASINLIGGYRGSLVHSFRQRRNDVDIEVTTLSLSRRLPLNALLTLNATLVRGTDISARQPGVLEDFEDRVLTLSYSKILSGRKVFSAQFTNDREVRPDDARSRRARIGLQKSIPGQLGLGYRFNLWHQDQEGADGTAGSAQLDWATTRARLRASVSYDTEFTTTIASAEGSLVYASGGVHAQRHLQDGFAVVDTGDVSGVEITRNHQLVAVTDRNGKAVIPALVPYYTNAITIDIDKLPMSMEVTDRNFSVVPRYKGGAPVRFGVKRQYAALLTLVDSEGEPLPAGLRVVNSLGNTFPVARQGKVFVSDLETSTDFHVIHNERTCRFELNDLEFGDGPFVDGGEIPCKFHQ